MTWINLRVFRSREAIWIWPDACHGTDGEAVFNFGKYKGQKVADVFRREPSYYRWMMQGDFPKDTKDIITAIYIKGVKK